MNFWMKLAIFLALEGAYGLAVWHVESWYVASQAEKLLVKETEATKVEMKTSAAVDAGYNTSLAAIKAEERKNKIVRTHEKATPACRLDTDGLSALRTAIAAGIPAR